MTVRQQPYTQWDANDHGYLVPYMAKCLRSDGYSELAAFLEQERGDDGSLLDNITLGIRDADFPISPYWVNILSHFHDPCTHRGLEIPESAADAAVGAREKAVAEWVAGHRGLASIHLGRALHVLTDVSGIPHHAACIGYITVDPYGHRDYEDWLKIDRHWEEYAVGNGGYYAPWQSYHVCSQQVHSTSSQKPYDWVDQAGAVSKGMLPLVDKHGAGFRNRFPRVAATLVPATIRWGAGFIQAFFSDPEVVAHWPTNPAARARRSHQAVQSGWR